MRVRRRGPETAPFAPRLLSRVAPVTECQLQTYVVRIQKLEEDRMMAGWLCSHASQPPLGSDTPQVHPSALPAGPRPHVRVEIAAVRTVEDGGQVLLADLNGQPAVALAVCAGHRIALRAAARLGLGAAAETRLEHGVDVVAACQAERYSQRT
jgi:hypothetical protein